MSSTQNPTTLESKLEALQCHFTWDLDPSRSKLLRLRDKLEDIGTEEGNSWLAHIYNLQGYIHYKLGSTEEAQRFFNKAAETFKKTRPDNTEEGPWLVVNCGNQAWLHHHLGNQAESQKYLSKVQDLMEKYPPPPQEELHPEVYAEKAWTLINVRGDKKLISEYFERAIRMEPDRVEWNTCYVIQRVNNFRCIGTEVDFDILEKLRIANEKDPENLNLAVIYLRATCCRRTNFISVDEAINLSEEAVKRYPDIHFLKKCLTHCYKWKILFSKDARPEQAIIDRAISLHEELIRLYPESSLLRTLDLANVYAKSTCHGNQAKAAQIYQELLERELEPADKQMLYNNYARYLNYDLHDRNGSIDYHMKAAEISHESVFCSGSIRILEKIRDQGKSPRCREIEEFLENVLNNTGLKSERKMANLTENVN
ncbi:uncharacterized protein V6R79_018746 [Siganus canaliculatus]